MSTNQLTTSQLTTTTMTAAIRELGGKARKRLGPDADSFDLGTLLAVQDIISSLDVEERDVEALSALSEIHRALGLIIAKQRGPRDEPA